MFKKYKKMLLTLKLRAEKVFRKRREWLDATDGALQVKAYENYEEYLQHQRIKLQKIKDLKMDVYEPKFRKVLKSRLTKSRINAAGKTVLCLAARLGAEVKAFSDLGAFAVGIDLNPGEGNRYVLHGDFHDMQFPESSVDIAFTNSLDHSQNLEKLLQETRRVLKKGGYFVVEIVDGTEEGKLPGYFESLSWKRVDDIIEVIEGNGFSLKEKRRFKYPWSGIHCLFLKKSK